MMEATIANLSKNQISIFFSENASSTQQQCDQEAERLIGMSVYKSFFQGGISYTVVCDDENLLQLVEQAYMGFMPPLSGSVT